jgi:hypothetical protein
VVTVVATGVTGADAALAPLAMARAAVLVVVEELPAVTTRSTRTPPAATTVSASARTHTPAVRGATTGALTEVPSEVPSEMPTGALIVEVLTVADGATPTPGVTALEETATARTTVATDGTGQTATRGAATGSTVSAGAAEEDAMEASAADVIGAVSRRKTRRRLTSRAKQPPISQPSPTSRRVLVA